jgi:hypothetical protein
LFWRAATSAVTAEIVSPDSDPKMAGEFPRDDTRSRVARIR